MNPRTQFVIAVTVLVVIMGLLTFSQKFDTRANAAAWPPRPDVSSGVFSSDADGTIKGTVYNADRSATIPYAGIGVATDTGGRWSVRVYCASSSGHFSVSLEFGSYKVAAGIDPHCGGHLSYLDEFWREKSSWDTADLLTLAADNPVIDGIDFTLEPASAISGHVYQADGVTPIVDARVNVNNAAAPGEYVSTGRSGVDGSYWVPGLPAGTYILSTRAPGWGGVYYINSYDDQHAAPVTVLPLAETSGINFLLMPEATISGRVFEADGVTPIAGAEVAAWPPLGGIIRYGTTDAAGGYTVGELSSGSYTVKASAAGRGAKTYPTSVSVTQLADTPNINFVLEASGAISGHIYKADGVTPITDVLISVHAHGVSPGSSSLGTYASQIDGSYTISGLAPGTYKVQGNNNREPGYVSEYYNNKLSWDGADLVTVVADQTTANINFTLEPTGAISGHVYEQDGVTPVAGAHLAAHGPDGRWDYTADTGPDGSYTMRGMPSNTYQIKVEALGYAIEWYNDKPTPGNADWVTVVAPSTTTGIDFKLKPGGAIAGRVFKADGVTPVNDAAIQVCADPTAPNLVGNCSWISQPSGSYTIPGLTPDVAYKVRANHNLAPGYVAKYYNNKYSWDAADPVLVIAKQTTDDINFALEAGGAISGHIYQQDGITPVANACVHVSSTAPAWNQIGSFCCTGSDGSFTINGLAAGQVYLRTNANCQGAHPDLQDEWYAASGSTPDGNQATAVQVVAGQTTTGLKFALDRVATVSGVVLNADGSAPIARANIGWTPADNPNMSWDTCTNDAGRFTLSVPFGSYKFFARGDSVHCGSDANLAQEFWRETRYWDQAQTVTLTSASPTVTGMDFTLELGGSIRGTVYDVTGTRRVGGGVVAAWTPDRRVFRAVCASADGSFDLFALPLGDYQVGAQGYCNASPHYIAEYWRERQRSQDADVLTLSQPGGIRDGIDFTLEMGGAIAGQVLRGGTTVIGDATVWVDAIDPVTGNTIWSARVSPTDGSYTIWQLRVGTYKLKAWTDPPASYLIKYYNDKLYADQADAVDVVSDQTTSNVNLNLDRGAIAEVPPATRATLVYTDTQALTTTVQIPAAAVTKTTTLVYTEVMAADAPSGFAFAKHAFDLAAYQEDQPVPGLTFNEPATIVIRYSDADVARVDEATLELRYWNGSVWSTDGITLIERDVIGNRLVATISHLSKFATFGEPKKLLYLPLITRRNP